MAPFWIGFYHKTHGVSTCLDRMVQTASEKKHCRNLRVSKNVDRAEEWLPPPTFSFPFVPKNAKNDSIDIPFFTQTLIMFLTLPKTKTLKYTDC